MTTVSEQDYEGVCNIEDTTDMDDRQLGDYINSRLMDEADPVVVAVEDGRRIVYDWT